MRRAIFLIVVLSLLLVDSPVSAAKRGWFPRMVGECGWVYGRYGVYNGSGLSRIWIVGTNHIVNQRDGLPLPAELSLASGSYPGLGGNVRDRVFGEFFICAEARYKGGHMQHVVIKRTRQLVLAMANTL